uniref:Uncharacterized protein n=1 Tax=Cohnella candidum TaxID=2674991 RepID=A0A3G3JY23_9BACL|nr:hypothetical protein EAV92_11085 [Cohnella candidum]
MAQWESAKRILDRHAPGFADDLGFMAKLPLAAAANNPMGGGITQDQFDAISRELLSLRE